MKQFKKTLAVSALIALVNGPVHAQDARNAEAIGTLMGSSMIDQAKSIPGLDADAVAAAAAKALTGEPVMPIEEAQEVFQAYQQELQAEAAARAAEAKASSDAWLAEYAAEDGVIKTESGVYYRVLEEGTGASPANVETEVAVYYRGTLQDGSEFDGNMDENHTPKEGAEPVRFPLNAVIPGWRDAVALMKEGDLWEVVIPSDMAYGEQGNGPVPPNSALKFEIRLVEVVKPEAEASELVEVKPEAEASE
ncbi:FKBP-type peptidyl-prolyl cis-trans isomerase N-terminal domain-containing protein [Gammaproteobacteria bacterium]|nr:FKBP-type peptidyl-prolyl cis-trans isomerase N-terminal domain-containing protein [Gammaproteobacteria bacterium]